MSVLDNLKEELKKRKITIYGIKGYLIGQLDYKNPDHLAFLDQFPIEDSSIIQAFENNLEYLDDEDEVLVVLDELQMNAEHNRVKKAEEKERIRKQAEKRASELAEQDEGKREKIIKERMVDYIEHLKKHPEMVIQQSAEIGLPMEVFIALTFEFGKSWKLESQELENVIKEVVKDNPELFEIKDSIRISY